MDTKATILQAAIELFKEKGFKGATTRAIAHKSGVNEVTIFRHFQNKEGLIKAAFEQTSYAPALSNIFEKHTSGILEQDLLHFSKVYQRFLKENSDLILISLQESSMAEYFAKEIIKIPRQLKEALITYFSKMQEEGKIIDTNLEAQALTFIWINFGYFQSSVKHQAEITSITEEEFFNTSISTFARGLTP
ncbi:TetR/AcrR family transcriptional regulator [Metabacillus malikii]|uniref:AcrR family transcriptional regulator n=1 Tax=Metabacillus malikii TaxID=1504265 RepID=A0ABT9ZF53_9BACI|nr:TetR/AcrR family transcriptional regulator [Metabacillus malikii]MDQ0230905.1 AcrR family transcriptional regulator [Metabacillus malikii]